MHVSAIFYSHNISIFRADFTPAPTPKTRTECTVIRIYRTHTAVRRSRGDSRVRSNTYDIQKISILKICEDVYGLNFPSSRFTARARAIRHPGGLGVSRTHHTQDVVSE